MIIDYVIITAVIMLCCYYYCCFYLLCNYYCIIIKHVIVNFLIINYVILFIDYSNLIFVFITASVFLINFPVTSRMPVPFHIITGQPGMRSGHKSIKRIPIRFLNIETSNCHNGSPDAAASA